MIKEELTSFITDSIVVLEKLSKLNGATLFVADVIKEHGDGKKTLMLTDSAAGLLVLPDGKMISASGRYLDVWYIKSGKCLKTFNSTEEIDALAALPNGQILSSGVMDFEVWDVDLGECINTFERHATRSDALIVLPKVLSQNYF